MAARKNEQDTNTQDCAGVPITEKEWFCTVNNPMLRFKGVNRIWPEMGDHLDHRSCASNNTSMGAVVHGKLEGAQLRLCYTTPALLSTLLTTGKPKVPGYFQKGETNAPRVCTGML
jgi:hypothetical protein